MTESAQATQARDTLLLSHANPKDNEFTLWLALQLANEGYRVWCDLTKLLGGEVFWDDIEEVIKARAAKVLYVLSRTSNAKDGPLKELRFAQGVAKREKLKDFVIPRTSTICRTVKLPSKSTESTPCRSPNPGAQGLPSQRRGCVRSPRSACRMVSNHVAIACLLSLALAKKQAC